MNIEQKQLLTIVKVIEKLQLKLKDNNTTISSLDDNLNELSKLIENNKQELNKSIDTNISLLKKELQATLNDLQRQFKNDRETKDIKLSNYTQDNKLGLNELKTTLQDLSNKLQDYASKEDIQELDTKINKEIEITNKEITKTNKKVDKLEVKVDKIPKVDLTDYAKKKDIPKVSYRDWETDRKSTRLNSSHSAKSRMPSSA